MAVKGKWRKKAAKAARESAPNSSRAFSAPALNLPLFPPKHLFLHCKTCLNSLQLPKILITPSAHPIQPPNSIQKLSALSWPVIAILNSQPTFSRLSQNLASQHIIHGQHVGTHSQQEVGEYDCPVSHPHLPLSVISRNTDHGYLF